MLNLLRCAFWEENYHASIILLLGSPIQKHCQIESSIVLLKSYTKAYRIRSAWPQSLKGLITTLHDDQNQNMVMIVFAWQGRNRGCILANKMEWRTNYSSNLECSIWESWTLRSDTDSRLSNWQNLLINLSKERSTHSNLWINDHDRNGLTKVDYFSWRNDRCSLCTSDDEHYFSRFTWAKALVPLITQDSRCFQSCCYHDIPKTIPSGLERERVCVHGNIGVFNPKFICIFRPTSWASWESEPFPKSKH